MVEFEVHCIRPKHRDYSIHIEIADMYCQSIACIIKRVSWFKSSLLLTIKTVDITNINS
jgi:hypothetical protein